MNEKKGWTNIQRIYGNYLINFQMEDETTNKIEKKKKMTIFNHVSRAGITFFLVVFRTVNA